jgi:hypothetical protein
MHADNLEWVEMMQAWEKDPANQGGSIKGDDRSPAFRWLGCLYTDRGKVAIPADNLMTLLREGGARCPTGKGKSTFKSLSQSGLIVDQISWPLLVNGKEIPTAPLDRLREEADFKVHEEVCKSLGFELFVKRAKIGQSKHVRVRPRFENWSCSGTITVIEDQITEFVLSNILTFAGRYSGLGDWRPSSPKSPGSWGKFTAVIEPFSGE